ncbi:MAG: T9SS type A sorting domain-containing protein [Flavobacterium sp.]|nr:T9SS type A sorting domain-containing protein [Flavobacterium sp.]
MKKILFVLVLISAQGFAQAVSGYLFSQTTEIYTPVAGTNSTATGDDGIQNNIPFGFPFNFGGEIYTSFSLSTNGWIRLGGVVNGQSWVNNLSPANPQNPLIAAFWDDHNRTTGSIQFAASGVAPNRMMEIGWDNINIGNGGAVSPNAYASFKMVLHETSGIIEFIYSNTLNSAGALTASIGLVDVTSFLSVSPISNPATVSTTIANNTITSTQFLLGQKMIFTPQPYCSGLPTPGNTLSSSQNLCDGFPFDLSVENPTTDFGIAYQWESSTDGLIYNPIANGFSAQLSTTQFGTHWYQCVVSCGASTQISTPILVTATPPSICYCVPTYTNGKTDGDLISNLTITGTTLSNNTGTLAVNPAYTHFTGLPNYTAVLVPGVQYEINVTVGSYQQQNVVVWIDYNDDYVFSLNERVGYSLAEIGSNGTGTFTLMLDCTAPAGLHRMRVRDVWNTPADSIDPCANYGYGETEDYDITIEAFTGCIAPYGTSITNINTNSALVSWETGCGHQSWDIYIGLAGAGVPTIPTYTAVVSPFVVTGLAPFTAYEIYVRANCGTNGQSDWSTVNLFTTLPLAVANDECANATPLIPGGTFQENAIVATNVGATKSIGAPAPTCAIFGFGGDVWFSTVVPADGAITIETQADPGSPLVDTGLTVFSGTCPTLTTLGCSDDIGTSSFSRLSLTGLTPGSTIYARVWEYANDTFGTFQVSAWNTALSSNTFEVNRLHYFPNPASDMLTLSYAYPIQKVTVFSVLGESIFSAQFNSNQVQLPVSNLTSGTYWIKIESNDQNHTVPFLKK